MIPPQRPARVLITGGSSGIGLALAQQFSADGADVLTTGRRNAAPHAFPYIQADLSAPNSADGLISAVQEFGWDQIDTLILNAGLGHVGVLDETPTSATDAMIAVNVIAPLELAHKLQACVTDRIVFIGSTAFKGTHPEFAVYSATKAALRGAVRSWQVERQGQTPLVQMIHPGPTETEMHDRAGLGNIAMRKIFTPSHVVAASIRKVMSSNKAEVSLGIGYTLWHAVRKLIF